MPALNLDTDADRIAERLADPGTLLVACLCAEWCGTCRDYRAAFDQLADAHPDACFAWIDIETHADRLDDLDVENFPTILIEDAKHRPLFRHGAAACGDRRANAVRPQRRARRTARTEIAQRARRRSLKPHAGREIARGDCALPGPTLAPVAAPLYDEPLFTRPAAVAAACAIKPS